MAIELTYSRQIHPPVVLPIRTYLAFTRSLRPFQSIIARILVITLLPIIFSSFAKANWNQAFNNEVLRSRSTKITVDVFAKNDSTSVIKYLAELKSVDGSITRALFSGDTNRVVFTDVPTPVEIVDSPIPTTFQLLQNYPNPFNPSTKIPFKLDKSGKVSLKVYNVLGQEISTLVDGELSAGSYEVGWNPNISAGAYFYRLVAEGKSETKKMIATDRISGSNTARLYNSSGKVVEPNPAQTTLPPFAAKISGTTAMDYTLRIIGSDSTSPRIIDTLIALTLDKDTVLALYLDKNERNLIFNVEDYFLNAPVDSFYVGTSMEKKWLKNGEKARASLSEEHVVVNGPNHLRSGIIVPAGNTDQSITHYVVNADTSNMGIDSVYFKGLLTNTPDGGHRSPRGPPGPKSGDYAAVAPTSFKDTIWVYGNIQPASLGFKNVEQLNEIAKLYNEIAKLLTTTKDNPDGFFGANKQLQ